MLPLKSNSGITLPHDSFATTDDKSVSSPIGITTHALTFTEVHALRQKLEEFMNQPQHYDPDLWALEQLEDRHLTMMVIAHTDVPLTIEKLLSDPRPEICVVASNLLLKWSNMFPDSPELSSAAPATPATEKPTTESDQTDQSELPTAFSFGSHPDPPPAKANSSVDAASKAISAAKDSQYVFGASQHKVKPSLDLPSKQALPSSSAICSCLPSPVVCSNLYLLLPISLGLLPPACLGLWRQVCSVPQN